MTTSSTIIRKQQALKALGSRLGVKSWSDLKVDGVLGPKTLAALSQWQVWRQSQPKGPDISHYQGDIDWDQLKLSCDFVVLRSSASLSRDNKFKEFRHQAIKREIPWGVYHYFTPWRDPLTQAELVMDQLGDLQPDLPIILDVEAVAPKPKPGTKPTPPVSPKQLKAVVSVCLESLEVLSGHRPIIYTYSAFDWANKLGATFGQTHKLWIADYREGPPTVTPEWRTVVGHQWVGDEGTWKGVKGPCDGNYLEVSLAELGLF